MSTRRLLLALSSPFPLKLIVQYHSNLGGYLYTPGSQLDTEGYEKGSIFRIIRWLEEHYFYDASHYRFQYGDFTLYIWDNDVEVYIDGAYFDDGNIEIYGHDESENAYIGIIYTRDGTTTLNGTTYKYCPGEIYMHKE